jgi:hypothetical protein
MSCHNGKELLEVMTFQLANGAIKDPFGVCEVDRNSRNSDQLREQLHG